jgi:6-phosphogluconolactonase
MKTLFSSVMISFLILFTGLLGCNGDEQQRTEEQQTFDEFIYTGAFSDSEGISVFGFDRADLSFTHIQTLSDRTGAGFQAIHPDGNVLYSVSGQPLTEDSSHGTLSAYKIDRETGKLELLNERSAEGRGPAHVSVDPLGRFVYVSNYSSGNISVFAVQEDGGLSEVLDVAQHEGSSVNERRQQGPHAHAADPSPDGRFLYVSDLGIDKIKIYEVDRDTGVLTPAVTPYAENEPGAGPRHFTFHPNAEFAYSVEELSLTVAAFSVDNETGALEQIQRVELLPDDIEGDEGMTAADIHISPDGNFLYATTRGADIVTIFSIDQSAGELRTVGHESTLGGHPRNFMIDQKGEFILVANRDNDNVVMFIRDSETGELEPAGAELNVPRVVCVTQLITE